MKHTIYDLKQMQSLPLKQKVILTETRVSDWFCFYDGEVYVACSGGKDSTVLAHICAKVCKKLGYALTLVFVDTGLEYPEIRKFVRQLVEILKDKYQIIVNLEILRPKMRFDEVIKKYGYPVIGKRQAEAISLAKKNLIQKRYSIRLMHLGVSIDEATKKGLKMPDADVLQKYISSSKDSKFNMPKYKKILSCDFNVSALCCNIMKKSPSYEYQKRTGKKPLLATMAAESALRESAWLKNGCNAFDAEHPSSTPMSFWTEQDVLQYIREHDISIASVYGDVVEAEEFAQMDIFGEGTYKLKTTGCDRTGCIFCGFGCHLDCTPTRFQRLKETHPKQYEYCIGGGEYDENGLWIPNKQGLGLGKVFDKLNEIYGQDFIKYK